MARKKKPEEHVNHERWLVSYADFITLLFAFFTTMYAISTVDAQKMGKMVMSMRASFDTSMFPAGSPTLTLGGGSGGGGAPAKGQDMVEHINASGDSTVRDAAIGALQSMHSGFAGGGAAGSEKSPSALKREFDAVLAQELKNEKVTTRLDRRGLIISIGEAGLFDSGSDQIRPDGLRLLDRIATGLVAAPNQVRIEGHTDNVPIRTARFPSNWELSTARATSVVSYLIQRFGLAAPRLSAAGYGEYRPVAANDRAEGRAKNRRVDILVMDAKFAAGEPR